MGESVGAAPVQSANDPDSLPGGAEVAGRRRRRVRGGEEVIPEEANQEVADLKKRLEEVEGEKAKLAKELEDYKLLGQNLTGKADVDPEVLDDFLVEMQEDKEGLEEELKKVKEQLAQQTARADAAETKLKDSAVTDATGDEQLKEELAKAQEELLGFRERAAEQDAQITSLTQQLSEAEARATAAGQGNTVVKLDPVDEEIIAKANEEIKRMEDFIKETEAYLASLDPAPPQAQPNA